jgi:hypothetical protein
MLTLEQRSCSGSSTEMELGSLFDDCCSTIDTHFYVLVLTVELRNDGGTRHRNPPGQGYPTGVLTLPYQGLRVKIPY